MSNSFPEASEFSGRRLASARQLPAGYNVVVGLAIIIAAIIALSVLKPLLSRAADVAPASEASFSELRRVETGLRGELASLQAAYAAERSGLLDAVATLKAEHALMKEALNAAAAATEVANSPVDIPVAEGEELPTPAPPVLISVGEPSAADVAAIKNEIQKQMDEENYRQKYLK